VDGVGRQEGLKRGWYRLGQCVVMTCVVRRCQGIQRLQ
jgi:hypothetical protein